MIASGEVGEAEQWNKERLTNGVHRPGSEAKCSELDLMERPRDAKQKGGLR